MNLAYKLKFARLTVVLKSVSICALSLFLSGWSVVEGEVKVVYVSPDGADDAAGTEQEPLRSIQTALDRAEPGTVVRLLPGVYRQRIIVTRSGEEGKPIVLEGARGPNGERLSEIRGSVHVALSEWEEAFDVGPHVYALRNQKEEPNAVFAGGRSVPRLNERVNPDRSMTAREILQWPEDYLQFTRESMEEIPFWETLGGVFYKEDDVLYLRLAEGNKALMESIEIGSVGAVIEVNAAYITLKGVRVTGGEKGILVQGRGAHHVIVEECEVPHGRRRIEVVNGVEDCQIIRNELVFAGLCWPTGSWAGGRGQDAARKFFTYRYYKYWASYSSVSDDAGISVFTNSRRVLVEDNYLNGGLIGIALQRSSDVYVRNNRVENFSSVGTALREGTINVHYDGNYFQNNSINIRLHNLNLPEGKQAYIYRNISVQPEGVGTHIFCHFRGLIEDYTDSQVDIYHNLFVGGARMILLPHGPWSPHGMPGLRMVNNVILNCGPIALRAHKPYMENADFLGYFDYNWIALSEKITAHGIPPWFGEHNVFTPTAEESQIDLDRDWTQRLPNGSHASGAGIDISKPFVIAGKTYPALPGFEPGYYQGEVPDMGAVP